MQARLQYDEDATAIRIMFHKTKHNKHKEKEKIIKEMEKEFSFD